MAWQYQQSSGWLLRPDGTLLGCGYSGAGNGKDNPKWQQIEDVGPIPAGVYRIGDPIDHAKLGDYALPLTPDAANQMFGRRDFFIHGDSIVDPGHASTGCIVLPRQYREAIVTSGDRGLEVVPGWAISA